MSISRPGLLLVICMGGFAAAPSETQLTFVYTNNNTAANTVSGFLAGADGALTQLPGSPFLTGGSGAPSEFAGTALPLIVTTAARNFLYAANAGDSTVSAFSLNTSTGSPSPVSGSPFPASFSDRRFALAITPDDKFLLITSGNGVLVAV